MLDFQFLLAGNAIFTISNDVGEHYTFKVRKKEGEYNGKHTETYFVSLLTGPQNESDYTYLGILNGKPFGDRLAYDVKLTKASTYQYSSKPVRVFQFALRILQSLQKMPDGYDIRHAGKCGRCARTLTTPESLDQGFGPECINHI